MGLVKYAHERSNVLTLNPLRQDTNAQALVTALLIERVRLVLRAGLVAVVSGQGA